MLLRSSWAMLLLCATAGFLRWLGLAAPPEKEELWETWMRSALDETPVVQLMQNIIHQMGNVSSRGAAELRGGHQVVPFKFHQEQERTQDVHPQPESILVLQEVMEKLQRVNQSLELMLTALEDAQSHLEKHLEHLKAIPDLDGQSQSATSSCIPHSSYFLLLFLPLVPASFRAILLLIFLASSTLGIPGISTLLVLAVAGHWLVASVRRVAGRIRPVVPREEPRYRLTSTPERECEMELLQEELDRMEMSCLQELSHLEQPQEVAKDIPGFAGQVSPNSGGQKTTLSLCRVTAEPAMDAGKLWEPKPCSPKVNMSPCQGLTRAGQRCRKKAIPGQEFCHIHTTGSSLATDSSPHF
ncbi:protein brambleberry-like [Chamaea fasciata]|uniref:protein brambleberry-like n=1 Tax=Chamaea fasciata TaxID=190680 RepID=UPI00336AD30E